MSLKIENLQSGYGDKVVLRDISLEVETGETIVLMGPSGSGKSTLLLTILGILPAKNGRMILNEKNLDELPLEERNIGYVPQDYGLFPHLNVFENVSYGLKVRGIDEKKQGEVVKEMLELVNLSGFEKSKVTELSGGQKQRIALARALAIKPNLLLLDEPLDNIDQITKFEVAKNLKKLFSKLKIPIIIITHNNEDAIFLSDKLAILINGELQQIGKTQEVVSKPKSELVRMLLTPFGNYLEK